MSPWLPLPAQRAQELDRVLSGTRLQFGIRPEHMGLKPRADGQSTAVAALMRSVEHMGNEVFVHVSLGGVPLTARVPAEDLTAVATWLAAQPLPAVTKPVARLPRPPEIACGSAVLPAGRVTP